MKPLILFFALAADNELTDAEKSSGWKLLFDGKDASAHWRGYTHRVLRCAQDELIIESRSTVLT